MVVKFDPRKLTLTCIVRINQFTSPIYPNAGCSIILAVYFNVDQFLSDRLLNSLNNRLASFRFLRIRAVNQTNLIPKDRQAVVQRF